MLGGGLILSGAGLLRVRIVALAVAIAVVLATGTWFALTRASAQDGTGSHSAAGTQPQTVSAVPLRVVSVSPASEARGVNGANPVRIVFPARLAADSPLPALSPAIAGSWQLTSGNSLQFVPRRGFVQDTVVTIRVPGGPAGVRSASGGLLARTISVRFRTATFARLRLQQLLAQLGYLPLNWMPAASSDAAPAGANAQLNAAFSPHGRHVHLEARLPEAAADLLAAGQLQPGPDRRRDGVRILTTA